MPDDHTTSGLPTYKVEEDTARTKLQETARKHLQGVEYQLLTHFGNPAPQS